MRGRIQNSFLFIATFAALILTCASQAHAQGGQPPAFPAADCRNTVQTAIFKGAQDYYAVEANVFANYKIPKMASACLGGLMAALNTLGQHTNILATIWNLVWTLVIQPMILAVINGVCQAISGAIDSAISLVKTAICIPMPGFGKLSFNLGSFSGGSCNGIAVIPALTGFGASRTALPGVWRSWSTQ